MCIRDRFSAVLFTLYTVTCGINYYKTSFTETYGIKKEVYTTEELYRACEILVERMNELDVYKRQVKAMRKDVLAKCYGGDISRKKKLLEKQKEGKKRMRQVGNVEIPQKAFMSVLKLDDK